MANLLDIRNPIDLTATYGEIEVSGGTNADGSSMSVLATVSIDTTTANDLSSGYTTYSHAAGDSTWYYKFRYKVTGSATYSSYSDLFQAFTSVMHARFRTKMADTNSNNYYFTNDDISLFLNNSINKLYPHTYSEVIDESLTSDNTTRKYNFPVGVFRINDLELIDSQGDVSGTPAGYNKRSRQIIFNYPLPSGYTIRLYCDKRYTKLAEVPEQFDDLILDLMRLEAYEVFEADRSQYYKYTTTVNPEGGNLPSIATVILRLEKSTKDRLNSLSRTRRPGQIRLN